MSELDMTSTDAMHWAEQFCNTMRETNFEIDEGLMVGWFANHWSAIYTPLQARIAKLEAATTALEDAKQALIDSDGATPQYHGKKAALRIDAALKSIKEDA